MDSNHVLERDWSAGSELLTTEIDLRQLHDFLGTDPSEFRNFVCDAELTLRLMWEELNGALETRDVARLRSIAHEICGTCGNVGAIRLASLGRTLSFGLARADCSIVRTTSKRMHAAIERFIACVQAEELALR